MFGDQSGEFRERVKRLRLFRHWDQGTLASLVGLSAATISQIETGKVSPTHEQVMGIADALGYGPDFLTSELHLTTTRPWLRAYADASRREADARVAASTLAAEYVRQLDLRPLPDLIPRFLGNPEDDDDIEEAAMELRHFAQIDSDAVVANALRAAERLGCVVLPLESELGKHLGMSVRADGIPIVSVAKHGIPGDRQRFTVAHELGHLMLHASVPPPRDAREAADLERQAHRFASAFLVPRDAFHDTLSQMGGRVTLRTLAEAKAIWGVAIKALVTRCQTMSVISPDHARSLYKQISSREWTKQEPVEVPLESAQWFGRVMTRKAKMDDLGRATKKLAESIGGNADDLLSFADWTPPREAEILTFRPRASTEGS